MLFSTLLIDHNIRVLASCKRSEILTIDSNNKIDTISKYNFIGRLVNWIQDPKGEKLISGMQKLIAAMERVYIPSRLEAVKFVSTRSYTKDGLSLADPDYWKNGENCTIFSDWAPNGIDKYGVLKSTYNEFDGRGGDSLITNTYVPHVEMARYLAEQFPTRNLIIQVLIFLEKASKAGVFTNDTAIQTLGTKARNFY
jgi:hypothetical protein